MPVLIVRCPSDEATSGLGFVAIVARIIFYLEHLSAWPLRMLEKHPKKLGFVLWVAMVSVALWMGVNPAVNEWIRRNWWWVVLLPVLPWLLGLPLRLAIYGLAYGIDMLGLPLVHHISAEVTPMGHHETWLVPTSDSEELRAAHSEIYALPSVQKLLADWFNEQVMADREQRKKAIKLRAQLRAADGPQAHEAPEGKSGADSA